MHTTAFNHLDDALMNIERAEEPWSVHLEVHVNGHFDETRLRDAIASTLRLHPMARARMQPYTGNTSSLCWEIADTWDTLFLDVVNAATEADVASARERLVSIKIPISVAPAFYTLLVHHADGDRLIINASHTLTDGLGTYRLLTSILRQYAGRPDPVPALDPLIARDLKQLVGSKPVVDRLERIKDLFDYLVDAVSAPTVRVAGRDGARTNASGGRASYGLVQMGLSPEQTARFVSQRQPPSTVNDLLLSALSLAILRWNEQRGVANHGRISIMMPINLRPQAWWFEIVGNFSSYCIVSVPSTVRRTSLATLSCVTQQTRRLKDTNSASTLIELLDLPRSLPAAVQVRLRGVLTSIHHRLANTATLSNLGVLPAAPEGGDAGQVMQLFFSAPAPMPGGLSLGAASMDDRLFLSLRYNKALFDAKLAHEFMGVLLREMSVV
jgi:NRPS condensation-like uncharacterized protein